RTGPGRPAGQAETMRRFQAWGYPVHLIDEKQLRALEPNVVPGVVSSATHAEIEGSADPGEATQVIMARAARAGAKIVYPVEVNGLDLANGRLRAVKTTTGAVDADI